MAEENDGEFLSEEKSAVGSCIINDSIAGRELNPDTRIFSPQPGVPVDY